MNVSNTVGCVSLPRSIGQRPGPGLNLRLLYTLYNTQALHYLPTSLQCLYLLTYRKCFIFVYHIHLDINFKKVLYAHQILYIQASVQSSLSDSSTSFQTLIATLDLPELLITRPASADCGRTSLYNSRMTVYMSFMRLSEHELRYIVSDRT